MLEAEYPGDAMKNMRTIPVERSKYNNHLQKAEEFIATASRAYEDGRYNASVLNSIHAVISAADALVIYVKGLRYAGTKHEEAVEFFSTVFPGDTELKKNVQRFGSIISIKTRAEYTETLQKSEGAENALRDAERFLNYVKSKLPKG